jgi:hypothetical protein
MKPGNAILPRADVNLTLTNVIKSSLEMKRGTLEIAIPPIERIIAKACAFKILRAIFECRLVTGDPES